MPANNSMSSRLDSLIADRYMVQRFADLLPSYQMAIIWFMAVDGQTWDGVDLSSLPWVDPKTELMDLLPKYVQLYGDCQIGTASLSATKIQGAVMCDPEIAESFASWDDYHADYLRGGVPQYPEVGRWPVILSDDDGETLRDGWHRFHSYVRDGASVVPVVFFPNDHHLSATVSARVAA